MVKTVLVFFMVNIFFCVGGMQISLKSREKLLNFSGEELFLQLV